MGYTRDAQFAKLRQDPCANSALDMIDVYSHYSDECGFCIMLPG